MGGRQGWQVWGWGLGYNGGFGLRLRVYWRVWAQAIMAVWGLAGWGLGDDGCDAIDWVEASLDGKRAV